MQRSAWIAVGLAAGAVVLLLLAKYKSQAQSAVTAAEGAMSNFLDKLKALVEPLEGLRLQVYKDEAGKWTVGYGHLVKPGEPYIPYGHQTTITQDEADALLDADTTESQQCVARDVIVPITDDQRAALVSLVYNIGCAAFSSSTLLELLNTGDVAGAAAEFDKWNHVTDPATGELVVSAGLTNRRAVERQLFETGIA